MSRIFTLSDLLKSEADFNSREHIKATNVKMGQLVLYPKRGQYLVALSDSEHGQVMVQPQNCLINLDFVKESDITDKVVGDDSTPLTVEAFIKAGDVFGIQYVGTPIKE